MLHRSGAKPSDPDEDVDGAHKVLGGKCRFSRSGDTIGKWDAILPADPIGDRFAPLAVVGNPRPSPVDFQMQPLEYKIAQLAKTRGSLCHRAERTIQEIEELFESVASVFARC